MLTILNSCDDTLAILTKTTMSTMLITLIMSTVSTDADLMLPDGVGGKCELSDIDLMGLKLGSVHNGQVRKWVWSQVALFDTF